MTFPSVDRERFIDQRLIDQLHSIDPQSTGAVPALEMHTRSLLNGEHHAYTNVIVAAALAAGALLAVAPAPASAAIAASTISTTKAEADWMSPYDEWTSSQIARR